MRCVLTEESATTFGEADIKGRRPDAGLGTPLTGVGVKGTHCLGDEALGQKGTGGQAAGGRKAEENCQETLVSSVS